MAENEKIKGELNLALSQVGALTTQVHDLTQRLSASEECVLVYQGRAKSRTAAGTSITSEDAIRDLELKLSQTRVEFEALKEELALERERVETFRGISQASEERLSEMNLSYDVYKQETQAQLESLNANMKKLEAERDESGLRLNRALAELTQIQEKMDTQKQEYQQHIDARAVEMHLIRQNEQEAKASEEAMKLDVQRHAEIARQARDNYEREVVAHSDALQSLKKIKELNEELSSHMAEANVCLYIFNLKFTIL